MSLSKDKTLLCHAYSHYIKLVSVSEIIDNNILISKSCHDSHKQKMIT